MRLPTVLLLVATLFAALAKSTSEPPNFDITNALVDNNNNNDDDGRGVEENRPSELVPSSIFKNASMTSHGCTAAVSPPRHASVPFFLSCLFLFSSAYSYHVVHFPARSVWWRQSRVARRSRVQCYPRLFLVCAAARGQTALHVPA